MNEARRAVELTKLCRMHASSMEGGRKSAARLDNDTTRSAILMHTMMCLEEDRISLYKAYVAMITRQPKMDRVVDTIKNSFA